MVVLEGTSEAEVAANAAVAVEEVAAQREEGPQVEVGREGAATAAESLAAAKAGRMVEEETAVGSLVGGILAGVVVMPVATAGVVMALG